MGSCIQARTTFGFCLKGVLAQALDVYRLDNGHYPSTDQGLNALVRKPIGLPAPRNWNPGGYIKRVVDDPWGMPYVYESEDGRFKIYSLGADRRRGGAGVAADIVQD